jgi:hypothetical protein
MSSQHSSHGRAAGLSRRALLGGLAAVGTGTAVPSLHAAAVAGEACTAGFRVSLSVSPVTESVLKSVSLSDGKFAARTVRGVAALFRRYGANEVFVRVATLRNARLGDQEHGFARAIDRARLARDQQMPLNPELGLWAVYGDIRDQPAPDFTDYPSIRLPGPWSSLTLAQMEAALRQYGELVARQILSTGVRINYWDLGNEVEYGFPGVTIRSFGTDPATYNPPDAVDPAIGRMTLPQLLAMTEPGRIGWLTQHLWPSVGRLLAAVAHGVRSVDRSARFSTHISGLGVDGPALPIAFWEAMHLAGYHPAQFGTSFYPTTGAAGDRRAVLLDVAEALHLRFGKRLFLAEFSYPSGLMGVPFAWNTAQAGYPLTPDGQSRYLRDLVAHAIQAGTISGIRPWGPDYCLASKGWEPMSLFNPDGSAKPALTAIQTGIPSDERQG